MFLGGLAHYGFIAHSQNGDTVFFYSLGRTLQHSQGGVIAAHHIHDDLHCRSLSAGVPASVWVCSSHCWKLDTARWACAI